LSDIELEDSNLKLQRQLRSSNLKRNLEYYIIPTIINHYDIAALRVLVEKESQDIWIQRKSLEDLLNKEENIVGFISCLTTLNVNTG